MSVVPPPTRRSRLYETANHRTSTTPRFLSDFPYSTPPKPPLYSLINFSETNAQKRTAKSQKSHTASPLLLGLLSTFAILTVNALCSPYFDISRASIVVFFSLLFLPFVRPARWLTKFALRLSLWSVICTLAMLSQGWRLIYRLVCLVARSIRRSSRRNLAFNRKIFLSQVVVGVVGLYILAFEMPLLRLISISYRVARFMARLMRAFVLLQYYMLLLASLEILIYLRVDCVMALVGAPWFRWAVHRVWSVLTWTDIVLAFSPSAYYYVHLSFHDK